jgi:hypothetical protein
MTQRSYFWNGLSVGDAVLSPYDDTDTLALIDRLKYQPYPEMQSSLGSNCPTCTGLAVTAGGAGWSDIAVAAGSAMVNGRSYNNSAVVTLNMTLHVGSWWAVVLRSDTLAQTIRLALKGPYITENIALTSSTQNKNMWEVVIATVYQGIASPTCYDQRVRTIRHNYVYRFIPAIGGYNTTHASNLQHRSGMGFQMPDGDDTQVYGQFMIDYDLWSSVTISPIVIPLGSIASGDDIYIDQYYGWGVVGELWNQNFDSAGYAAISIVEQVIQLPVTYAFSPKPVVVDGLISCLFYRDATDVLDTYAGSVYCPGWRLTYISYTR